jgi:hypothetical protein
VRALLLLLLLLLSCRPGGRCALFSVEPAAPEVCCSARHHRLLKDIAYLFNKNIERRILRESGPSAQPSREVKALTKRVHAQIDHMLKLNHMPHSIFLGVTNTHRAVVRDLFLEVDSDGSGAIDRQEVHTLADLLGVRDMMP